MAALYSSAAVPTNASSRTAHHLTETPIRQIAQTALQGTVVSESGIPMSGATVVLWRDDREIARLVTGSTGAFAFDDRTATSASALIVRRIGYQPRTISARDWHTAGEPLRVVLALAATPLPVVVSTEGQNLCRGNRRTDETVSGRAMWTALAARYAAWPLAAGVGRRVRITTGSVHPSYVGQVDEAVLTPAWSGTHGSVRQWTAERIKAHGYTFANPTGVYRRYGNQSSDRWWYAPLADNLPDHLVGEEFGSRHWIRQLSTEDGAILLAFCGREKNSGLEGIMLLDHDTSLVRVRWQYRTGKPQEDAGGQIEYAPQRMDGPLRAPMPLNSVFWRREGNSGYYYQEAMVYMEWLLSSGEEIPRE